MALCKQWALTLQVQTLSSTWESAILGILYLACQYHIHEQIAEAACTELMDYWSAPEILLFKRFRSQWQSIDQNRYGDSSTKQIAAGVVYDTKEELIRFLAEALTENQPRDEYRELMELTLMFLGTSPLRSARFTASSLSIRHAGCPKLYTH